MQGITTSLTMTFVVMLGLGFALLNMAQHMPHAFSMIPRTLVQ
jgi:hypothetical protein